MTFLQRAAAIAATLTALAAPMLTTVAETPAPAQVLAACDETIDTTDSFSMNCAPTVIPDVSDQLTEAEVAEPGWNAVPGGSGGGAHR